MPIKFVSFKKSNRKDKRMSATFYDKDKQYVAMIHFGLKGGETFIDHNDETKKENYLKRHVVRENWMNPLTPGALSRWILWNNETLDNSINDYTKRFGLIRI